MSVPLAYGEEDQLVTKSSQAVPGQVKWVNASDIRSNFNMTGVAPAERSARRELAQAKLLRCIYYGSGEMHGVARLYEKVKKLKVDTNQALLHPGDFVQISGGTTTLIVERRINNKYTLVRRSNRYTLHDSETQRPKEFDRQQLILVHGITRKQVAEFLLRQEIYQLSRRPKRVKEFRPLIPNGPRNILQIDLIGPMSRGCDGVAGGAHAIVVVDALTRKAWTGYIKTKTAAAVGKAFKEMLPDIGRGNKFGEAVIISSDNGDEFTSAAFMQEVNKFRTGAPPREIRWRQYFGVAGFASSQAYVERTNQTIKSILYRILAAHNNKCFAKFLPRATEIYNDSIHSAVGMTPNEADRKAFTDDGRLRAKLLQKLERQPRITYAKEQRSRLEVGDIVRLVSNFSSIQKRYYNNWRQPLFKIKKVHEPKSPRDVLRYQLEALVPKDERLIKQGTQRKRYKRNMLLKLPSADADSSPENLTTFKDWCQSCASSCLDYDEFVTEVFGANRAASSGAVNAEQEAKKEYIEKVLRSRTWYQVQPPESMQQENEKNAYVTKMKGRLFYLFQEIKTKAMNKTSYLREALEFMHELLCIQGQYPEGSTEYRRIVGTLEGQFTRFAAKEKDVWMQWQFQGTRSSTNLKELLKMHLNGTTDFYFAGAKNVRHTRNDCGIITHPDPKQYVLSEAALKEKGYTVLLQ